MNRKIGLMLGLTAMLVGTALTYVQIQARNPGSEFYSPRDGERVFMYVAANTEWQSYLAPSFQARKSSVYGGPFSWDGFIVEDENGTKWFSWDPENPESVFFPINADDVRYIPKIDSEHLLSNFGDVSINGGCIFKDKFNNTVAYFDDNDSIKETVGEDWIYRPETVRMHISIDGKYHEANFYTQRNIRPGFPYDKSGFYMRDNQILDIVEVDIVSDGDVDGFYRYALKKEPFHIKIWDDNSFQEEALLADCFE